MTGPRGKRWAFAAGVAAALGFGGTQALAAPAEGDAGTATCSHVTCYKLCIAIGALYGECSSNGVTCACYFIP